MKNIIIKEQALNGLYAYEKQFMKNYKYIYRLFGTSSYSPTVEFHISFQNSMFKIAKANSYISSNDCGFFRRAVMNHRIKAINKQIYDLHDLMNKYRKHYHDAYDIIVLGLDVTNATNTTDDALAKSVYENAMLFIKNYNMIRYCNENYSMIGCWKFTKEEIKAIYRFYYTFKSSLNKASEIDMVNSYRHREMLHEFDDEFNFIKETHHHAANFLFNRIRR